MKKYLTLLLFVLTTFAQAADVDFVSRVFEYIPGPNGNGLKLVSRDLTDKEKTRLLRDNESLKHIQSELLKGLSGENLRIVFKYNDKIKPIQLKEGAISELKFGQLEIEVTGANGLPGVHKISISLRDHLIYDENGPRNETNVGISFYDKEGRDLVATSSFTMEGNNLALLQLSDHLESAIEFANQINKNDEERSPEAPANNPSDEQTPASSSTPR